MSETQIQIILNRLDLMEKERAEKHEVLMTELENLKLQIAPIADIYSSAKGFGNVIMWITKWIVTPLIVLLGACLTYKQYRQ